MLEKFAPRMSSAGGEAVFRASERSPLSQRLKRSCLLFFHRRLHRVGQELLFSRLQCLKISVFSMSGDKFVSGRDQIPAAPGFLFV